MSIFMQMRGGWAGAVEAAEEAPLWGREGRRLMASKAGERGRARAERSWPPKACRSSSLERGRPAMRTVRSRSSSSFCRSRVLRAAEERASWRQEGGGRARGSAQLA